MTTQSTRRRLLRMAVIRSEMERIGTEMDEMERDAEAFIARTSYESARYQLLSRRHEHLRRELRDLEAVTAAVVLD